MEFGPEDPEPPGRTAADKNYEKTTGVRPEPVVMAQIAADVRKGVVARYSAGHVTRGFHMAKRPAGLCFHTHACKE